MSSEAPESGRISRRRHARKKTILGLVLVAIAVVVAVFGATMAYLKVSGKGTFWGLVPMVALVLSCVGNVILIKARGYSPGLVYAVLGIGYFGGSCIPGFNHVKTVNFFWVFLSLLMTTITLCLPRKAR